jgi:double-stranded uracil-DNA glycosylase
MSQGDDLSHDGVLNQGGFLLRGFPPVSHPGDRVLILGSFPSVSSLERVEYYGFPRNHFWRLISDLTHQNVPQTYKGKLTLLESLGISLWDVIATCRREGSLDSAITDEEANPIGDFLADHGSIRTVFFNGLKAEETFARFFAGMDFKGIEFTRLPSSSPVPGRKISTYEKKLEVWKGAFARLPG